MAVQIRVLKSIFLVLLFAGIRVSVAQEKTIMHGQVRAGNSQQSIAFASISLVKSGAGTACNGKGEFSLVLPPGAQNDSLRISALGYQLKLVALNEWKAGTLFIILLNPSPIQLAEVSVSTLSATGIIEKAISRIPDNYLVKPHVLHGFYRNSTRNGSNFLELSEAAFDIFHFASPGKSQSQLKLLRARDVKNERDLKNLSIGQKPGGILRADIVRSIGTHEVFGKEGLKKHRFRIRQMLHYQGREVYELTFDEKPGLKDEHLYRGSVYIDSETYAFLYFGYSLSPPGLAQTKIGDAATRLLMKAMGIDLRLLEDNMRVSYRPFGKTWVLAEVMNYNLMRIKNGRQLTEIPATVTLNYLVTGIDTTQKLPFSESLSRRSLIEDHDSDPADDFWKDYTILLPDFNTAQIIAKLKAINQELNLKDLFVQQMRKLPKDAGLRIDSMLSFFHQRGQFNGTALIAHGGKVILQKSYGYADTVSKLQPDSSTAYRIGSLSKSFTSLLIAQLENEGKLDYDAPLRNYLPQYIHGEVSIGQLLSHQSGIPNFTEIAEYKAQILTKPYPLDELVARFCSDSLEFKPGTKFAYSNSNFVLLAKVAEVLGGKPFERMLHERIFNPLNMQHTFTASTKPPNAVLASGYWSGQAEYAYPTSNTIGAGGIYSTAADLLLLHQALMHEKLLPKAKLDLLFSAKAEFPDYKAYYGYGFMIDKGAFAASGQHQIMYHPGTDLGFFTMFVHQPDRDNCIVLLSNMGEFPRYALTDMILGELNR